ncbi:MAG: T9SS type A sorting domain-containing protein [Flavobacteriaceae bacterium]|nr:T9SS type A sorting domain-containing protein [Flavobacteriaceae bacterium]
MYSQNTRWEDFFNYQEVKGINQVGNKLYCTSSNALFSYDLQYNELQKISKANFLNAVEPTSVVYSETFDYLIIGYQSGELDILGEQSYNFIEIPLDEYQGNKQINHLSTWDQYMLISAAYGVSLFNLERREFSETAFFRQNGEFFTANESDFFNGRIYTASERGVFSHELNDLIPNFNNWELATGLPVQNFSHIQRFGNKLMAASHGNLYVLQDNNWHFLRSFGIITDLNVNNNVLSVATTDRIIVLNDQLQETQNVVFGPGVISGIVANNQIYAGTKKQGLVPYNTRETIFPDGPISNSSFAVTATDSQIWLAPGGILSFIHSTNNSDGYSHFNAREWIHIPNSMLNNALDITHISYNPMDINTAYATSWFHLNGVFEVVNDTRVREFNHTNSSIIENILFADLPFLALGGTDFDAAGNMYLTQTYVGDGIRGHIVVHKKTPDNRWSMISLENFNQGAPGVKAPSVSDDGWVWVPATRGSGAIITNMTEIYQIMNSEDNGNLPSANVYTISIDKHGTAWIGTQLGLRIKTNPIRELQAGNPETQPVVIVQNGIPEALLTDTAINDIEVDGANQKWIGTQGAGAFYVSAYGRDLLFHFKEEDSPLPSNIIYDIAVDNTTGMVYFATDKGLMAYKGDAKDTGDSFGQVIAYPNPVRPGFHGEITIKGIAENADVRITDVVGNLIYKTRSSGGIVKWNQTNLKGQKVASGIYLVLMINADGTETATAKIAIVR